MGRYRRGQWGIVGDNLLNEREEVAGASLSTPTICCIVEADFAAAGLNLPDAFV